MDPEEEDDDDEDDEDRVPFPLLWPAKTRSLGEFDVVSEAQRVADAYGNLIFRDIRAGAGFPGVTAEPFALPHRLGPSFPTIGGVPFGMRTYEGSYAWVARLVSIMAVQAANPTDPHRIRDPVYRELAEFGMQELLTAVGVTGVAAGIGSFFQAPTFQGLRLIRAPSLGESALEFYQSTSAEIGASGVQPNTWF